MLYKSAVVLGLAAGYKYTQHAIHDALASHLPQVPQWAFGPALSVLAALGCLALFWADVRIPLLFAWNCFLKPLSVKSDAQSDRLDAFYTGQASLYDQTRSGLLKGRTAMLQLAASHLKAQNQQTGRKKIWVSIGGGTGWEIEEMSKIMDIKSFDSIYLIDLCEPLLEIARQRFAAKGWTHVHCLRQNASEFMLPEWSEGLDPRGSITLATLSYSLSMIPSFYPLLDRVHAVLDPDVGLVGVADFYTSKDGGSARERAIGSAKRQVGWLARWFWQIWFDFDHVHLGPERRDYLEYKFGTIKSYNGRNGFIVPLIIKIPYYCFIGCSRQRDITPFTQALDEDTGNTIGLCSPALRTPATPFDTIGYTGEDIPDFALGPAAYSSPKIKKHPGTPLVVEKGTSEVIVDMGSPPSAFHYQLGLPVRVPYLEEEIHSQFRTHVYGFTWEDPDVDVKTLKLTKDDSMLVITSAGDNALHYAIAAKPQRIHCVDMNPCQGHILELKLAAAQALPYDEYFALFGTGRVDNFRRILEDKLAPYLSSHAYQYWCINETSFADNFHFRGYSGHALRLAQWAFWLAGVKKDAAAMCSASNKWEQEKVWKERLRPVIMNPLLMSILGSPVFLWNALGVPLNQMRMFLEDGTTADFVSATLDPVAKLASLKNGAYHYLLCLNGKYTPESCPLYLTKSGYDELRKDSNNAVSTFRLHTSTIMNVLRGLPDASLTKAILMDSQDWFSPIDPSTPLPSLDFKSPAADQAADSPEKAYEELKHELDLQIRELMRVMKVGGEVYYRSAGKRPWYNQRYTLAGFDVKAVAIREDGKAIDRVNMYASFYKATKRSATLLK